jgi:hypothetical protein
MRQRQSPELYIMLPYVARRRNSSHNYDLESCRWPSSLPKVAPCPNRKRLGSPFADYHEELEAQRHASNCALSEV